MLNKVVQILLFCNGLLLLCIWLAYSTFPLLFLKCRRELLHPVEVCLFYRSSFQLQGLQAVSHGVPVHIHCRTKEVKILVS